MEDDCVIAELQQRQVDPLLPGSTARYLCLNAQVTFQLVQFQPLDHIPIVLPPVADQVPSHGQATATHHVLHGNAIQTNQATHELLGIVQLR